MLKDKKMTETKKHIGLLFLRGIIAILFGIAALIMPAITALWMLRLIAIFIFIDAIILLFNLIRGKIHGMVKTLLWVRAILGLFAGIVIVFIHPLAGTLILGLALIKLMGLQSILIGLFESLGGLKNIKKGGWWPVLLGLFWIIFGVTLFVSPAESLISITWASGLFGLALGVSYIMMALKSKNA